MKAIDGVIRGLSLLVLIWLVGPLVWEYMAPAGPVVLGLLVLAVLVRLIASWIRHT